MAEIQYSFPYHKKTSHNLPSVPRKQSEGISHYRNTEDVSLGTLLETVVPNCRFLQRALADADNSNGNNIPSQI